MKKTYPIWLYKPGNKAVLVNSKAEEKAIGWGWVESPAKAAIREKSYIERIRRYLIKILGGVCL